MSASDLFRKIRNFFVSLQLTVILLVLSMLLVFFATIDQVNLGIWAVQQKWFRSFFVYGVFANNSISVPLFPGGYLLGGLLFVNLVASHIYRFRLTLKKAGILVAHFGLLLLLVGEFFSGLWQEDYRMTLNEGETSNYVESFQRNELAIKDITAAGHDIVTAIPEETLARAEPIQHHTLPFRINVRGYFPNSAPQMRSQMPAGTAAAPPPVATAGIGTQLTVIPLPITNRPDEQNVPSAYLELVGADGAPLGTWLVTTVLAMPQTFTYQGKTWSISLRTARLYLDFSLQLLKVTHDVYPGTEIPKNFSSRVILRDANDPAGREVVIYMNNPLRHNGLTFYQYQMNAARGNTVFQVVRNPTWTLPYLACALTALGLAAQFVISLACFIRDRSKPRARNAAPAAGRQEPARMKKIIPAVAIALCAALVAPTLITRKAKSDYNFDAFGRLPVLVNGRVKPLDTVARTTLLRIRENQSPRGTDGRAITPAEWLLDTCFNPVAARQHRIFKIMNPEVLALLRLTSGDGDAKKYFSYIQLEPHLADIERQARLADSVQSGQRNAFQRAVLSLYGNLIEYQRLQYSFVLPESPDFLRDLIALGDALAKPDDEASQPVLAAKGRYQLMAQYGSLLAVPLADNSWAKVGDALQAAFTTRQMAPAAMAYAGIAHTWQARQPEQFNETVRLYGAQMAKQFPDIQGKINVEWRFNHAQPFYMSTILYVLAFLLGVISWLKWPEVLGRSAFGVMSIAWVLTTAGILTRMWLEGRPPVTNLYSSALGVGWCAVTLCIILEAINKNTIASVAGSLIGMCTLIIAHNLSLSGDTMEMMRAVLDSNFWLATHVVTITIGYGATFLAGGLGIIYIVRSRFTRSLDAATAASLERMVYGIVCFATLFSFVGTVLGGIWADQSWGRFWGWDPKENGALIIVIWNAIVLHVRWGKLLGTRGLMSMAVFGNVVTAWSWFGTNLLEVGLHSYGFTDSGAITLGIFMITQIVIIGLAQLRDRSLQK